MQVGNVAEMPDVKALAITPSSTRLGKRKRDTTDARSEINFARESAIASTPRVIIDLTTSSPEPEVKQEDVGSERDGEIRVDEEAETDDEEDDDEKDDDEEDDEEDIDPPVKRVKPLKRWEDFAWPPEFKERAKTLWKKMKDVERLKRRRAEGQQLRRIQLLSISRKDGWEQEYEELMQEAKRSYV